MRTAIRNLSLSVACVGGMLAMVAAPAQAAWKPTRTVEFIVPAGIGGGAGQMAQLIQGIIQKHKLMDTSMVVISKKGGSGAEGFLYIKNHKNDPHKIIITLSNLFTTPLATGSPFSWKDYSPIAMMALDEFVFWVNSKTPYKTPSEYMAAVKKAGGKMKMGGTGSKQEDQIITAAIEQKTGDKFTYVPYKGGGTVATQLVGGHIDSSRQQSDRAGGALARRQHPAALRVRQQAHAIQGQGNERNGVGRYPDLQVQGTRHRIPDVARHHDDAGRVEGRRRLLCGPAHEGSGHAGVEGVHGKGRLQSELHDRRRVQ